MLKTYLRKGGRLAGKGNRKPLFQCLCRERKRGGKKKRRKRRRRGSNRPYRRKEYYKVI